MENTNLSRERGAENSKRIVVANCPAKNSPGLGYYCYDTVAGSDCLADDCQAMSKRQGC
jgi:hypothetical protein